MKHDQSRPKTLKDAVTRPERWARLMTASVTSHTPYDGPYTLHGGGRTCSATIRALQLRHYSRRRTPYDALLRQSSPWYVLRRLIPLRDDMRRHETTSRRLDTTFIIIILGVGVRFIKEGGWAHWSLASLTFYHLHPVAQDFYNGCPAIPRSPHASHVLAVTVS